MASHSTKLVSSLSIAFMRLLPLKKLDTPQLEPQMLDEGAYSLTAYTGFQRKSMQSGPGERCLSQVISS